MTRRPVQTRRRLLAALIAGGAAAAAPFRAPTAAADGRGRDDRGPGFRSNAPLRAYLPKGGRFRPRRLWIATRGGERVARLPRTAAFEGPARLPVARAPLIGPLFGAVPAAHFVRPENRVGALFRLGEDLLVDLRQAPEARVEAWLAGSIQLLTHLDRAGAVELGLPASLPFRPARAPEGPALSIGSAYAAGPRLLLAPPYESLFGARLF